MKRRAMLLGTVALVAMPSIVRAHPVHASATTIDVRGNKAEVTLKVTPEDLQEALRRRAKRPLDVDTDPDVDTLARAYVDERFVLSGPDGPLPMTWVGCEVEAESAHLYFEFELPSDLHTVKVRNAVFFEVAPAQINRVQVRRGKATRTLRFRATDPARPLLRPRR